MKIVREVEDGWDFANLVRDYVDVKSGHYIPYIYVSEDGDILVHNF